MCSNTEMDTILYNFLCVQGILCFYNQVQSFKSQTSLQNPSHMRLPTFLLISSKPWSFTSLQLHLNFLLCTQRFPSPCS